MLADWATADALANTGFAEGAADRIFSSLVQLDQALAGNAIGDGTGKIYDDKGKLIRNQGELFDSTLHFIGFGRGAVVNTEVVQRLGTFTLSLKKSLMLIGWVSRIESIARGGRGSPSVCLRDRLTGSNGVYPLAWLLWQCWDRVLKNYGYCHRGDGCFGVG